MVHLDGEARHHQGRLTMARSMRALLVRNNLSHNSFKALATWATPSCPTWISTSQISYLKRGKLPAPGPGTMDAIGQVNLGLAWLSGDDSDAAKAMEVLGLPAVELRDLIGNPWFLRNRTTGLPMDVGDIYRVFLGWIVPEGIGVHQFTEEDAEEISQAISDLLQQLAVDRGVRLAEITKEALALYPVTTPERITRLKAVIAGVETYSVEALTQELPALTQMLSRLLEEPITDRNFLEQISRSLNAAAIVS